MKISSSMNYIYYSDIHVFYHITTLHFAQLKNIGKLFMYFFHIYSLYTSSPVPDFFTDFAG